jgi:hypothetical protein
MNRIDSLPVAAVACAGAGIPKAQRLPWPVNLALAGGLLTLLAACANGLPPAGAEPEQTVAVAGVVIRNELAYPVTDVMIEVPATGSFAGCGTVLPRSECSNTFQQVDYRGNAVVVRWREHGQPHQTDEFTVAPPPDARAGDEFRVEVTVFAPGQAGARLLQQVPGDVRNR